MPQLIFGWEPTAVGRIRRQRRSCFGHSLGQQRRQKEETGRQRSALIIATCVRVSAVVMWCGRRWRQGLPCDHVQHRQHRLCHTSCGRNSFAGVWHTLPTLPPPPPPATSRPAGLCVWGGGGGRGLTQGFPPRAYLPKEDVPPHHSARRVERLTLPGSRWRRLERTVWTAARV